jgi:hypothetical protein
MSFVIPEVDTTLITGVGFVTRRSVKVASTTNVNLAANLNSTAIDGITVISGDRVLLKNQTTVSQNGVYVIGSGAGATLRAEDYTTGQGAASTQITVQQGTTQADTCWICTNDTGSDVIGTNNLVFAQFAGFTANQLIDHSTVSVNAGVGLTGGGDITTTRTISLDINGLTLETAPVAGDLIPVYDISATAQRKMTVASILSTSGDNKIISLRNTASITGIGGTAVSLTWDTENRKDAKFTHSTVTNSENITFNTAGRYIIMLDVGTDVSAGGSRSITRAFLELDSGAGFVALNMVADMYNRTTGAGNSSCSIQADVNVAATNILRARVQRIIGTNTIVTTADATRLMIISL